jgi:hypothetical protein
LYNVNIDFDEASREWNANKKKVDGIIIYCCGFIKKMANRVNGLKNIGININNFIYTLFYVQQPST